MLNELVSTLILAIIQGTTEWLPISSSGHLVLFRSLLQNTGGLFLDVSLHFGTLMAVFVYFGRDIMEILRDFLSGKWKTENGRLGWYIVVGTIPAALAGFFLQKIFEQTYDNLGLLAIGFGITGLTMIIASIDFNNGRNEKITVSKALWIGVAQAVSIIPSISRSGATIATGLYLGLKEKEAMKFSFLLSIPAILGANILVVGNQKIPPDFIWATLLSFVVGLATIHLLYKFVLAEKKNLRWFAAYSLILAAGIAVWLVF